MKESKFYILTAIMVGAWLIAACLFSEPNRDEPMSLRGLDIIALLKLASRIGTLGILVLVNAIAPAKTRLSAIVTMFLPLLVFLLWAIASTMWSPLRDVTLGQSFSLLVMVALAMTLARFIDTTQDAIYVLSHLFLIVTVRGAVMIVVHWMLGGTGVTRDDFGVFHSTDAAETAGLGMVMAFALFGFTRLRRFELLMLPAIVIHIALFAIAQNRLSLIVNAIVVAAVVWKTVSLRSIVGTTMCAACLFPVYIVADPGVKLIAEVFGVTSSYANRGNADASEDLRTFSGRTDLWEIVWDEYMQSPLRGCGYFVTSHAGEIDVWGDVKNYTAHNQVLQLLSTTGLVGLTLFLMSLVLPFQRVVSAARELNMTGNIAKFSVAVIAWLLLWGLLNESFCGPIGSATIVYYTLLGIMLSSLKC
ncbi:MAG: O-antigen ligase family protein [Planctomycetales bacterium]|nr:O-antigen ligase family protein [Planctomycetales bacterium]